MPAAVTVSPADPSATLRAMLSPRLPSDPEPRVVAVPLEPSWVAIPNKPLAVATDASPTAVAKVNASPVSANAPFPSTSAAPRSPLAVAVAPFPMATAMLKVLLVQPPPLPMPNSDTQVALAAGAAARPVPAMAAAHTPAAIAVTAVWRAGMLYEVMVFLRSPAVPPRCGARSRLTIGIADDKFETRPRGRQVRISAPGTGTHPIDTARARQRPGRRPPGRPPRSAAPTPAGHRIPGRCGPVRRPTRPPAGRTA